MRHTLLATLALAASVTTSFAGPAADRAKEHFSAIAAGDVGAIVSDYGDRPIFQWIGGPLDGVYADIEAIRTVWTKFSTAQGPLKVTLKGLEEATNPKGATVTANLVFTGKMPIPVRYVLVYRDGRIVSEVWQINPPKAAAGAGYKS